MKIISNSDSTTFTPASLLVSGDLVLDAGRDIALRGANVEAGSAVVVADRDLLIESLQDAKRLHFIWGIKCSEAPRAMLEGHAAYQVRPSAYPLRFLAARRQPEQAVQRGRRQLLAA